MNKKALFTFLSLAISLFLSDRPINQPVAHTPENKPAAYNSSHSLKTSAGRGDVAKKHQILALNHVDSYHDSASVPENKTTPSTSGTQPCRSSTWLFNQERVTVPSYATKHFVKDPVAHTVQIFPKRSRRIDHGLHPQKMNTRLNEKYIQPSQKLPSVGITKKNSIIKKAKSDVEEKAARATDRYNKNLQKNMQKKAFNALKKAKSDAEENAARAKAHYNKNMQKNMQQKAFKALKKAAQEERLRQEEEERKRQEEEERAKRDIQDLEQSFMNKINAIYKDLEATKIEEREELSSSPNDLSPSAWIVQTLTDKIYDYLHTLYLKIQKEKRTIGEMANQYTQQIRNVHNFLSEGNIQIAKEIATEIQDLEKRSANLLTISEQYKKLKTAIHTLGQKNESDRDDGLDSRIANDVKDILQYGENGILAITIDSITAEVQTVIKDKIDNIAIDDIVKEDMGIGKAVSIEDILEELKKQYEEQWDSTLTHRYQAMKDKQSARQYMMDPSTRGPSNPIQQSETRAQRIKRKCILKLSESTSRR